jgi:chaperonin GroES
MSLKPLHDRIVVKRVEAQAKTASGLFIPDTAQEKQSQGVVVAVGNGRINDKGEVRALTVKTGDTVIFGKYVGTEIKFEGQDLLIMSESDVLAVIG